MLKELTVKNLRSFNKEVTFSMEADYDRVGEYKDHVVELTNNKLLKVASMYGPNGGGKTNLILALNLSKAIIKYSEITAFRPLDIKCVFSDDDVIEETLFFVDDQYEMGFHFGIISNIEEDNIMSHDSSTTTFSTRINIIEETVVYRRKDDFEFKVLYERDRTGSIKSEEFSKIGINNMPNLAKGKTVLSQIYELYANSDFIENESIGIIKRLYEEIDSIDSLEQRVYPRRSLSKFILNHKESLIKLLNSVDINISNIAEYDDRPEQFYFVRELLVNGTKIKREIPLREESAGTKKIFYIFLKLINAFANKKIFYCDDMNAFLHPKLYRAIIELFNSEKNKSCQLIFNSHDITNMTNELFRRDEIWFAYRDESYSTQLIPLSNIVNYKGEQVRKDAKYSKQYLEGKYGADPFIKKGLNWDE